MVYDDDDDDDDHEDIYPNLDQTWGRPPAITLKYDNKT